MVGVRHFGESALLLEEGTLMASMKTITPDPPTGCKRGKARQCYENGYLDGYAQGWSEGFAAGKKAGKKKKKKKITASRKKAKKRAKKPSRRR